MDENVNKRNEVLAQTVINGLQSRNMSGYYAEDNFLHVHLEVAVFYLDEHVIGIAFLVLFIRRDECLRDLVDHVLLRNAALFFKLGQRRENFSVHVFCIPP